MSAAVSLAAAPALPLHEAGKYVAGAYVVLFALVLVYVAIMALRLSRMQRELGELEARRGEHGEIARSGASGDEVVHAGAGQEPLRT